MHDSKGSMQETLLYLPRGVGVGRGGEGARKKHLESRFGLQDGQRSLYSSRSSNLLDLFADHHGVLFSDFLSRVGLVIVRAIVYIGVTVYTAVNIPTPAFKPWRGQHTRLSREHISCSAQHVCMRQRGRPSTSALSQPENVLEVR